VPFAALHLKNSRFGIYSNAEGDFRILKSPVFKTDSLVVTCIGYYSLTVAFTSLASSGMNIMKLVPNIYGLHEVKVTARKKRLSSELIIARAIRNIRKNYPDEPFSFVSYYRDYQKDSTNYLNLHEAIIQTLDKGFSWPSDSNRYRLLDYKKNTNYVRKDITPYYDIPETDHSDKSFKRIPHAFVGDQYGNEFFVLLAHDSFRNYKKRTFSFVDTLTQNFIKNHWFKNPMGVYEGSTLLYKIEFTAKNKVTIDNYQGAIYIQPDDYSIYKLEYSGYYTDSEKRRKDIFNIEIEYGPVKEFNSKMFLKYISFNNTFTIPDTTDNNFFKILKSGWWQNKMKPEERPSTILVECNRKIDPASGNKLENYIVNLGKTQAKITHVKVDGSNIFVTVKIANFWTSQLDSAFISVKNIKDISGKFINERRALEYRQFRELFVQEYNKPLEFQDSCFIEAMPLEKNCISSSGISGRYWMNTPLKAEQKVDDREKH